MSTTGLPPHCARPRPSYAPFVAAGGRIIGKGKMTEVGTNALGTVMHYAMPSAASPT
jgi:hypothetical protein